ncbi:transposase [Streptomyces sp. M2CJ-2]|uniref:transposase n=1 Tax=Streptomyces sp. M2CJ-2 TaxID=2803948 RepID=UPI0034D70410
MSDAEWARVRDLLPVPAWLAGRGGRPEGYCHRQMIDAVRYLVDNGQYRCLRGTGSSSPRHGDRRCVGSLTGHASMDRVIR